MKVISLDAFRNKKIKSTINSPYEQRIRGMSKIELLEEMVRFQEERKNTGTLTKQLAYRGLPLFKALEEKADAVEFRILTGAYRRYLEHEIKSYENP